MTMHDPEDVILLSTSRSRGANLKGLLKDHKEGMPARPVSDCTESHSRPLSEVVTMILDSVLGDTTKRMMRSTEEVLKVFRDYNKEARSQRKSDVEGEAVNIENGEVIDANKDNETPSDEKAQKFLNELFQELNEVVGAEQIGATGEEYDDDEEDTEIDEPNEAFNAIIEEIIEEHIERNPDNDDNTETEKEKAASRRIQKLEAMKEYFETEKFRKAVIEDEDSGEESDLENDEDTEKRARVEQNSTVMVEEIPVENSNTSLTDEQSELLDSYKRAEERLMIEENIEGLEDGFETDKSSSDEKEEEEDSDEYMMIKNRAPRQERETKIETPKENKEKHDDETNNDLSDEEARLLEELVMEDEENESEIESFENAENIKHKNIEENLPEIALDDKTTTEEPSGEIMSKDTKEIEEPMDNVEENVFLEKMLKAFEENDEANNDVFEEDTREMILEKEEDIAEEDENTAWWKKFEQVLTGIGFNFVEHENEDDTKKAAEEWENHTDNLMKSMGFEIIEEEEIETNDGGERWNEKTTEEWEKNTENILRNMGFETVEEDKTETKETDKAEVWNENIEQFMQELGFRIVEDNEVVVNDDGEEEAVEIEIEEEPPENGEEGGEKKKTKKKVVFSMDATALYIDMDTIEAANLIMKKIEECDWTFNVNVDELTKYVSMNMNRVFTASMGLNEVLPRRKSNRGRPPTMRGKEMQRGARKNRFS